MQKYGKAEDRILYIEKNYIEFGDPEGCNEEVLFEKSVKTTIQNFR